MEEIKTYRLQDLADVIGSRFKSLNAPSDELILCVHRSVTSPTDTTTFVKDSIPTSVFGIVIKKGKPLLEDYLKFTLDSGVLFACLGGKVGSKTRIFILKRELESYSIPLPALPTQQLIGKLEKAWEWSKADSQKEFKYAELRTAIFDEIRHLLAYELYFPESIHKNNIYPLLALSEIEDNLSNPEKLFLDLMFEQPKIMDCINRFRSIVLDLSLKNTP